jgi:hypothetical protein
VVDDSLAPGVAVMGGLDAVAVRIEQERSVVVVAVLRPRARCALVGVTGRGTGLPELIDLLPARRCERDVEPAGARA